MKKAVFILFILVSLPLTAESKSSACLFGTLEKGSLYLFGDNVRIRNNPEIRDDNVVATLPAGFQVSVKEKSDKVMAMNGFSSNWYRVGYSNNGKKESGDVWGGLLAIGYVKSENALFLLGIKNFDAQKGFTGECRLISGGKIASSLNVELHNLSDGNANPFYGYNVTVSLNDGMGLSGLSNVVDIHCEYGACGYPSGHIWIGIADKNIYYLGKDTSVSEAGVFHYDERMIFPSQDKALKDEIRLVIESFEFDEKKNDYRLSDKKEKRFIWKDFKMKERK